MTQYKGIGVEVGQTWVCRDRIERKIEEKYVGQFMGCEAFRLEGGYVVSVCGKANRRSKDLIHLVGETREDRLKIIREMNKGV